MLDINKAFAAMKTLESLGYEHNGGEFWEPPISFGETQQKAMEQLQRESNYWASVQNERAAANGTVIKVKSFDKKDDVTADVVAALTNSIYGSLRNDIIKEYLETQISELKGDV